MLHSNRFWASLPIRQLAKPQPAGAESGRLGGEIHRRTGAVGALAIGLLAQWAQALDITLFLQLRSHLEQVIVGQAACLTA